MNNVRKFCLESEIMKLLLLQFIIGLPVGYFFNSFGAITAHSASHSILPSLIAQILGSHFYGMLVEKTYPQLIDKYIKKITAVTIISSNIIVLPMLLSLMSKNHVSFWGNKWTFVLLLLIIFVSICFYFIIVRNIKTAVNYTRKQKVNDKVWKLKYQIIERPLALVCFMLINIMFLVMVLIILCLNSILHNIVLELIVFSMLLSFLGILYEHKWGTKLFCISLVISAIIISFNLLLHLLKGRAVDYGFLIFEISQIIFYLAVLKFKPVITKKTYAELEAANIITNA